MRYIIVTPAYNSKSAGVVVLHELQKWLIRAGKDAMILNFNAPYAINDDDIVVYPEIVVGNPLNAKRVVRYILNVPGKIGGTKEYDSNEILVAYTEEFSRFSNGIYLEIPIIEDFFTDRGLARTVDCLWIGKGQNTNHPATKGCVNITYQWPKNRRELAELLNRTRILYSYDEWTHILTEATLCGCSIKLIRNDVLVDLNQPYPPNNEEFQRQLDQFIQMTWYPEMNTAREAVEHIESVISSYLIQSDLSNLSTEVLLERGIKLKRELRYTEAMEVFLAAGKQGDASALAHMGDCLANLGKMDEAEAAYRETLKTSEYDAIAHNGLGAINLLSGKHSAAAICFSKALKGEPDNAKALCGLGLARTGQGRRSEGFELFRKSLDKDPENLTALHEMLKGAYELNRLSEAESYLTGYLMYHPTDTNILFSLAGLHYLLGNYAEALDAMERLIAFEPAYEGREELTEQIRIALDGGVDGKLQQSAVALRLWR